KSAKPDAASGCFFVHDVQPETVFQIAAEKPVINKFSGGIKVMDVAIPDKPYPARFVQQLHDKGGIVVGAVTHKRSFGFQYCHTVLPLVLWRRIPHASVERA